MEFVSKEFPDLKLYYRFKKLTKNQNDFMTNLLHNILNNRFLLYEFPPTLDKDFLYNTVLFSLSLHKNEKFVIVTKNYDKINELMKNFTLISNICRKFNPNFNKLKIVPYFDRKMMCTNFEALDTASSVDLDSFCTKVTASWISPNSSSKCSFYSNYQNDISSSIKLEYEIENENEKNSNLYNHYNSDFKITMKNLTQKKICPFYYFFNLINETNPDIIICSYKDYFDFKSRIHINKLISDKKIEYKLIIDECADIDNMLTQLFSLNVDENLLFNASNQLFILKQKFESEGIQDIEMKSHSNYNSEREFILFNNLPYCEKIPGTIRKSTNLINLISRLIVFFKKAFFNYKNENVWNIYKLEQQLLSDHFLDFKKINCIFIRFILFLNELKFVEYQSIHHLLNFIFFLNYITIFNEGYILNYQKYYQGENFSLELYLIEPHIILQNFLQTNKSKCCVFLSGGIGKLDNFIRILKLDSSLLPVIKKSYVDDNLQEKIYLTNISNTNINNNSFYGEMLMKLTKAVTDGIICYFSSCSLMENYIQKWNEQGVFDYIMDDKLLFIEEQDSVRLSAIITNYKKACDLGRGGILFLSTRNKASLLDSSLTGNKSRCIIFIGFPIETKITKIFELKLDNYKKTYDMDSKEVFNYDAFKLFSNKIAEKIIDINDKKVLLILDEKLISDKLKDYLPSWLNKLIHIDFDKDNVNTDERLKNIKKFFSS